MTDGSKDGPTAVALFKPCKSVGFDGVPDVNAAGILAGRESNNNMCLPCSGCSFFISD